MKLSRIKSILTGAFPGKLCRIGLCFLAFETQAVSGATILPANAFWHVFDVSRSQNLGVLQAPFGTNTSPMNPPINTPWDVSESDPVWAITNTIDLTGIALSTVKYSTAIDNDFQLFVNGQSIETFQHDNKAVWSSAKDFPTGVLQNGINTISLLITNRDEPSPSYFSMRITDGCDDVPEVGSPQISSNSFSFGASGQPNAVWDVYSSTNLTDWSFVRSITLGHGAPDPLPEGEGFFSDDTIGGIPYRFYKLTNNGCCSQAIGFVRVVVSPVAASGAPGTNANIANQLNTTSVNTLDTLFNVGGSGTMLDGTALPDGSSIEKWDVPTQAFLTYTWNHAPGSGWTDSGGNPAGNVSLNPGEGGFLFNVGTSDVTVTFAGLVPQGSLSTSMTGTKQQIISAMVPKQGLISTDLGYFPDCRATITEWTGPVVGNLTSTYGPLVHAWDVEPFLKVGQAVFWNGRSNDVWQLNFSPCQ